MDWVELLFVAIIVLIGLVANYAVFDSWFRDGWWGLPSRRKRKIIVFALFVPWSMTVYIIFFIGIPSAIIGFYNELKAYIDGGL